MKINSEYVPFISFEVSAQQSYIAFRVAVGASIQHFDQFPGARPKIRLFRGMIHVDGRLGSPFRRVFYFRTIPIHWY